MDRIAAALPLALTCTIALVGSANAQSSAERAFQRAASWTVYIRTAVDRPFIEDQQGSFTGSGLVVDAKRGWILTNAHVASRSYSSIQVAFRGHEPMPARRLYVDPYLDIAILAYDPSALGTTPPEPKLECRTIPQVGHPVGAYGHPWGFRFTGTRGIASAVTSRLGPDMLQTDAPINGGNSGGPLLSLETGAVVGINAASMRKDRTQGLSFAVPMPLACTVLHLLEEGRDPSPPSPALDFVVEENNEHTLIVAASHFTDGSLDIRAGDKIVAVGTPARPVRSEAALVDLLRGHLDDVVLTVQRDGTDVIVRGKWPAAPRVTERRALWVSGAMFGPVDPVLVTQLRSAPALMVHHVESGSDAEGAEIFGLDLLKSVDGKEVKSLDELELLAQQAAAAKRPLELVLLRLASQDDPELFRYQRRMLDAADVEPIGAADTRAARAVAQ